VSENELIASLDKRVSAIESDIKEINRNIAKIFSAVKSISSTEAIWKDTMCKPHDDRIGRVENKLDEVEKKADSKWPVIISSMVSSAVTTVTVIGALYALFKSSGAENALQG